MSKDLTYWHRLEPDPQASDLSEVAAVRIADPLWMLARQWQVGEFRAEDAATPIGVEIEWERGAVTDWYAAGGARGAASPEYLETQVYAAASQPPDAVTRAEWGARIVAKLRRGGPLPAARLSALIDRWPLPDRGAALPGAPHAEDVLAKRASNAFPDGYEILRALAGPRVLMLPAPAGWSVVEVSALTQAARELRVELGPAAPSAQATGGAWHPATWGGRIAVDAQFDGAPSKTRLAWDACPDGGFRPHRARLEATAAVAAGTRFTTSELRPAHLRFPGMPSPRWWDLENGKISFADWYVEKTDLGRMVVADFLLQQEDDWFVVPLEMKHGQIARIRKLKVKDAFGHTTTIDPPTTGAPTSPYGLSNAPDVLLIAPSALDHDHGRRVEETVHWIEDEEANLLWAVPKERVTRWGLPVPLPPELPEPTRLDAPVAGPNRYVLRPRLPGNWVAYGASSGVTPWARNGTGGESPLLRELGSVERALTGGQARSLNREWRVARTPAGPVAWQQRTRGVCVRRPAALGWRFDALGV